jgi:predicted secreted hydrolase
VTDVAGGRFHHAERMARAAAGLGGVSGGESGGEAGGVSGGVSGGVDGEPLRLVCADWTAAAAADGDGLLPLQLAAGDRTFSFALRVLPGKPLVLQGDRGLSRKSAAPGNASIYYSLTRVPIDGVIEVDGERHDVRGLAWIDREWSTSALAPDQVGWDWFSLQLDDGTEVMWYQLRRAGGGVDANSGGTFVDVVGAATRHAPAGVRAEPVGEWTAPDGGARYPAAWRLVGSLPAFELEVTPLVADQELHVLVRYGEGAVAVRGTRAGRPVAGRGYLEMTGYAR